MCYSVFLCVDMFAAIVGTFCYRDNTSLIAVVQKNHPRRRGFSAAIAVLESIDDDDAVMEDTGIR